MTVRPQARPTSVTTARAAPRTRARRRARTRRSPAIAAIVSVVRPSRSARAPATTQPTPPIATTGTTPRWPPPGPRPRGRERRGDEQRQPRPHRVELPHVAEVAEVREPDRRLAERATPRSAGLNRATATSSGPAPVPPSPTTTAPTSAATLAAATIACQSAPADAPSARIRCGSADPTVSAPMSDADREAAIAAEPAGDHPQRDRVDRREAGAGQRPPDQRRRRRRSRRTRSPGSRPRRRRAPTTKSARPDTTSAAPLTASPMRRDGEPDLDGDREQRQVERRSCATPLRAAAPPRTR